MMIGDALAVDAVLPFSSMSAIGTDVVEARGGIVTSVELAFSRWELRQRRENTLVAAADMPPILVRPFAPFPCVVRLFGSGTPARFVRLEG